MRTDIALNEEPVRLDKWLWHARFLKTRSAATCYCRTARIRVNGNPMSKAHVLVRPGDVLVLPWGAGTRIVRVLASTDRRGSGQQARQLYQELDCAIDAARDGTF